MHYVYFFDALVYFDIKKEPGQEDLIDYPIIKDKIFNDDLEKDLIGFVSKEIGPIAKPDLIQNAPGLPKTRSGKIMRRILRKIAEGDFDNLGDTTTLAEPAVVESLLENSKKL